MTLAYILHHAVCCASAASSGQSLHLIISQLRMKYSSLNCLNHVRWTMSSIKKQGKVWRILRTMFMKQMFTQLRTGFKHAIHINQWGTWVWHRSQSALNLPIIILMHIYHALINALSAHMIHMNLNIFYTHVEHGLTKTIYIKYYIKYKK